MGALILLFVALCGALSCAVAREVLQLQGTNFELTLTTYKYLAVLFYDESELGRKYRDLWTYAAEDVSQLPPDSGIAEVCYTNTPSYQQGVPNLLILYDASRFQEMTPSSESWLMHTRSNSPLSEYFVRALWRTTAALWTVKASQSTWWRMHR